MPHYRSAVPSMHSYSTPHTSDTTLHYTRLTYRQYTHAQHKVCVLVRCMIVRSTVHCSSAAAHTNHRTDVNVQWPHPPLSSSSTTLTPSDQSTLLADLRRFCVERGISTNRVLALTVEIDRRNLVRSSLISIVVRYSMYIRSVMHAQRTKKDRLVTISTVIMII